MFDVVVLGLDRFFSFREGAVKFVIGVLGGSGGWCGFGGTSKAGNDLFCLIRYLTDLGHGGGKTVKSLVLESLN